MGSVMLTVLMLISVLISASTAVKIKEGRVHRHDLTHYIYATCSSGSLMLMMDGSISIAIRQRQRLIHGLKHKFYLEHWNRNLADSSS